MKVGLLWDYGIKGKKDEYDLKTIIMEASEYHNKKYGFYPDTCYINPKLNEVDDIETEIYKVKVLKDKNIPLTNLWIGCEEEKETSSIVFSE